MVSRRSRISRFCCSGSTDFEKREAKHANSRTKAQPPQLPQNSQSPGINRSFLLLFRAGSDGLALHTLSSVLVAFGTHGEKREYTLQILQAAAGTPPFFLISRSWNRPARTSARSCSSIVTRANPRY
jgi:hypothetical protein